ncbi:MAG: aminotransferase class I/II-fold pyridoxal phosphate-dependent enzyme [Candidatus Acidiferrales bacterium]
MPDTKPPSIRTRLAEEMEGLREAAQLRTLDIPHGVNLCSNDYLGLAADARLKEAAIDALNAAERVGSTGSRLLSGNTAGWEELESEFAEFAGTDAALYFNSGYAANSGLLSATLKPGDMVFSDALNHASIIDGVRLSATSKFIYPHADLRAIEQGLRARTAGRGATLIVTESVFSMEGDIAPVGELLSLARKYGAELIIDEAHATGVCGPEGRGVAAEYIREPEILAVVHTCGKALGGAGGFVCTMDAVKQYLVNRARPFVFSTAMPPYFAGQIRGALKIARASDSERAHLRDISGRLRQLLSAAGLDCGTSATQIIPVILGSNEAALRVAEILRDNGFAAKAVRPPTVPEGTSRIRVSLTSRITIEQIDRLAEVIIEACKSPRHNSAARYQHAQ